MRNVLFLVTGMTPQIITETVWALACDPNNDKPWVPDEIHVLSTEDGLNQIRSRLFSEKEGYKFAKFKQDFPQLAKVAFDNSAQYLHNIYDAQGVNLKDLKTPSDNELAADLICQKIREFTECDDVSLHVSIAGGRKTMGFYAGYALSLYGRAGDSMSHVLVDERYESARDFFYPTPDDSVFVTNRDGIELKAKDAQIWLARIPFVRLRASLSSHDIVANQSFSQVVEAINLIHQPIKLLVNKKERTITIGDKVAKFDEAHFAFYLMAIYCLQRGEIIIAPHESVMKGEEIDILTQNYKVCYVEVLSLKGDGKYNTDKENIEPRDRNNFDKTLSNILKVFKNVFGVEIASKIKVHSLKKLEAPYAPVVDEWCQNTKTRIGAYSLNLDIEQIEIV